MKRLLIEITAVTLVTVTAVLLFYPRSDVDRIEDWIDQQTVSPCNCSTPDIRPVDLTGRWQTGNGAYEAVIRHSDQQELTCDWTFGPASISPQTFTRQLIIDDGRILLDRPAPFLAEQIVSPGFCLVRVDDAMLRLQPCGLNTDDEQYVLNRIE